MQPVSHVHDSAQYSPISAKATEDAAKASCVRERDVQAEGPAERVAEYQHAENESPGLYRVEPSEDGPQIHFERPSTREAAQSANRVSEEKEPNSAESEEEPDKAEMTRCSTDEVDSEIKAVKSKVEALEQDLRMAQDEEERAEIEKKVRAAKQELSQKDNDTYRRQHAKFTNL